MSAATKKMEVVEPRVVEHTEYKVVEVKIPKPMDTYLQGYILITGQSDTGLVTLGEHYYKRLTLTKAKEVSGWLDYVIKRVESWQDD